MENLGERDVELVLTQDTATSSSETASSTDERATAGKSIHPTLIPSQEGASGSTFHTVSQDVGMGPVDSPDNRDLEIEDFEDDFIW